MCCEIRARDQVRGTSPPGGLGVEIRSAKLLQLPELKSMLYRYVPVQIDAIKRGANCPPQQSLTRVRIVRINARHSTIVTTFLLRKIYNPPQKSALEWTSSKIPKPKINSYFGSIQTGIQTNLLLTNFNLKAFSNFKCIALCIVALWDGFLRGVSFRRFYLGMLPTNCTH